MIGLRVMDCEVHELIYICSGAFLAEFVYKLYACNELVFLKGAFSTGFKYHVSVLILEVMNFLFSGYL
jgi:hypothetical protein